MTDPVRRHVVVRGRVQGVSFRFATLEEARRQGVAGFVRNQRDGSVEAAFEGPPEAVEALLAFVHRGPRFAEVHAVEAQEEPPRGESGFEIRS
jgi:acylphosphatase